MHNNIDDLRYIRSTMERSSKFLSLSGMSGVAAGLFALIGAAIAYQIAYNKMTFTGDRLVDLFIIAFFVVLGAGGSGMYFSMRKAKKTGAKFWMPATVEMIKDAGIPMCVGGIFCLLLIYHKCYFMVSCSMLLFYGLALINAGSKTYKDIKILGACQIVLGIIAGIFTDYSLLLWAIGFGVLHIIYGAFLYKKYDN